MEFLKKYLHGGHRGKTLGTPLQRKELREAAEARDSFQTQALVQQKTMTFTR